MAYLDELAGGLRSAAGVLNPKIQAANIEEDQKNRTLQAQQAQLLVQQLAKQVESGSIAPEKAAAALSARGINVPPELLGGPSLAAQKAAGEVRRKQAFESAMTAAGNDPAKQRAVAMQFASPADLLKMKTEGGFTLGNTRYNADGTPLVTAPEQMKKPVVGTVRKIQVGDQEVTQEYVQDGTWKEIGKGPKFARSVAPVVVTGGASKYTNVQPDGNGGFIGLNKSTGQMEKVPSAEGVTQSGLSTEAIDAAAQRYAIDGTLPPNLGRGTQGSINTAKILNRAAEQAKAQGNTAEEARIRQISGRATSVALSQISRQAAQVGAFERTLQKNADLALQLSDKLDRTGSPILNKWILAGKKTILGDPDVAALDLAIKTVVNEYAKILSSATAGGAQTAEGEIKKVEALLASAQTKEQVKKVIEIIRQETGNRMKSFDDEKKSLKGEFRSKPAQASGSIRDQADAILRGQ